MLISIFLNNAKNFCALRLLEISVLTQDQFKPVKTLSAARSVENLAVFPPRVMQDWPGFCLHIFQIHNVALVLVLKLCFGCHKLGCLQYLMFNML